MPDASPVDVDQDGHVLILRINRPESMNAINGQVIADLTQAVKKARRNDSVRCLVLTGAPRADGRPCFSAGDDLKEAAAGQHPPGNPGNRLCNLLDDLLKPSIAVIDGVCTTGATELALACDLRVVAHSAQVSDWHLSRRLAGPLARNDGRASLPCGGRTRASFGWTISSPPLASVTIGQ
ncbi:MAG TPA: enoyl-CoA hydratase/isomerase family protein [Trebonia sp.]|jgi:enoyl-CoA hydratase/carnithine racemase|nr:enoyl-CoA hydratase/isomerase family protein [Trebonia sp.]